MFGPSRYDRLKEAKMALLEGLALSNRDERLFGKLLRHLSWEASEEFSADEEARIDEIIKEYRAGKAEAAREVGGERPAFLPPQSFEIPKVSGQKMRDRATGKEREVFPGMFSGLSAKERRAVLRSFMEANADFDIKKVKKLLREFREQEAEIARLREDQTGKGRR